MWFCLWEPSKNKKACRLQQTPQPYDWKLLSELPRAGWHSLCTAELLSSLCSLQPETWEDSCKEMPYSILGRNILRCPGPLRDLGAAWSQHRVAYLQELARLHPWCCRARGFFSLALLLSSSCSLTSTEKTEPGLCTACLVRQAVVIPAGVQNSCFSNSKHRKELGKKMQPPGTRHWNNITTPEV